MSQMTAQQYVDNMFVYHPPVDKHRVEKHERINAGAAAFAEEVLEVIDDEELRFQVLRAIQAARMVANEAIVCEEVALNLIN